MANMCKLSEECKKSLRLGGSSRNVYAELWNIRIFPLPPTRVNTLNKPLKKL